MCTQISGCRPGHHVRIDELITRQERSGKARMSRLPSMALRDELARTMGQATRRPPQLASDYAGLNPWNSTAKSQPATIPP